MSIQITTQMKQEYRDVVTILQQQRGSNLREAVDVEMVVGENIHYDQISSVEMTQLTVRHADTVYTDTPHSRRNVSMEDWSVADLIADEDVIRTITSPQNAYVQNHAMAAARRLDQTIIDAFDATVSTGKNGSGTSAFDTSGFQIAVGASNLTTAKLRTARKILEQNHNFEDTGPNQWYCVCSADQREGLLGQTDFTSADFNSIRSLVHGEVDTWLGFHFLKSELLDIDSNNVRDVYCWRKGGMKLAIGAEPRGFIDILPGKNQETQVQYKQTHGSIRMDEVSVVKILCDEDL